MAPNVRSGPVHRGDFARTALVQATEGVDITLLQYGVSGQVESHRVTLSKPTDKGWHTVRLSERLHPAAEALGLRVENWDVPIETRNWTVTLDDVPWSEHTHDRKPGVIGPIDLSQGSGVRTRNRSQQEIQDIIRVARVWGFLKYRHPRWLHGELDFDGEFIRALQTLDEGRPAETVLDDWRGRFPAPSTSNELVLSPFSLGERRPTVLDAEEEAIREWLEEVHVHRATLEGGVPASVDDNDASLENESRHRNAPFATDAGVRMLSLARHWTAVEDFHAYRARLQSWPNALDDLVGPMMAKGRTRLEYQQLLLKLASRVLDGHAQYYNDFDAAEPIGVCRLPILFRHVEGVFVVESSADDSVVRGDVLLAIDGRIVADFMDEALESHPGATRGGRLESLSYRISNGSCGRTRVRFDRGGETMVLKMRREALPSAESRRNHPGPSSVMDRGVLFLNMKELSGVQLTEAIEKHPDAVGLIADFRDYPSVDWRNLVRHLHDRPFRSHLAAVADPHQPGGLVWNPDPLRLVEPLSPHFSGPVALLADHSSFSRAEAAVLYTKSAPTVRVFGTPTSGTDGTFLPLAIPGTFGSGMTQNVPFPLDGDHVQATGILPDVSAPTTLEDFRAGRDTPYDAAMTWLLSMSKEPW